ncbi:MAG: hypothetical protein WB439_04475 [Acidobacteriaceae bacterium]
MKIGACSRERELLQLLKSGSWPAASDPELREHANGCRICRNTIAVRSAFQNALAESKVEAKLDSANILWWRAQLRRRNEAVERVSRPLAGAHRFALALNLLAAIASAIWLSRQGQGWQAWLADVHLPTLPSGSDVLHSQTLLSFTQSMQSWNVALLIPCAAAIALLGGVVIYLAADRS